MPKTKKLVDIDLMFRAFSDPTRLRILRLDQLSNELCVCDLVAILQLPQPLVSRHLANLRKSGLVKAERVGQWKYYSLSAKVCEFHENLLCCVSKCFSVVPEFVADAKRAQKIDKAGDSRRNV